MWQYGIVLPFLLLITSFGSKEVYFNNYSFEDVTKHALYIGVVQITMEEAMTVQVKVFSDDLQAVLQNELGYQEVGAIGSLCETQAEHLQQYFQRTLQVHINEGLIELVLTDCEQINEVHLLHFKARSCPSSWQQVAIKANFFMELFPTQSNVVRLQHKDKANTRFGKMTLQAPSLLFGLKE